MAQAINSQGSARSSRKAAQGGWLKDVSFEKLVVFVNSLVPLVLILSDAVRGKLGANPLAFMTSATGTLALVFLLLSLLITPLRELTGWNSLVKQRRQLGLFAFFYCCLHVATYVFFDKGLRVDEIAIDVYRRPFILVGTLAFLLMTPLAVTSTNRMIKRLGGKRWSRLHKLAYPCAVFAVLHFYLLVKSDVSKPLVYAALLAVLFGYRFVVARMNSQPPIVQTSIAPRS